MRLSPEDEPVSFNSWGGADWYSKSYVSPTAIIGPHARPVNPSRGRVFGYETPLDRHACSPEGDSKVVHGGRDVEEPESIGGSGFQPQPGRLQSAVHQEQPRAERLVRSQAEEEGLVGGGFVGLARKHDDQRAVNASGELRVVVPVGVVDECARGGTMRTTNVLPGVGAGPGASPEPTECCEVRC